MSASSLGIGLHPGISWERYTGIDRTNISTLKELARSPLHYQYRLTAEERRSPSLSLGRSSHVATLEPDRFERDFVVWDERTDKGVVRPRRGKDWDAFCAANSGKTIIKADEHAFARAIRDAVRAKPVAAQYLRQGRAEVTMIWDDVATGRRCKGRVDWITHHGVDAIVGLKTARDGEPRAFSNQAAKLLYHLQFAFYYDGYSTITGKEPRVVELVVESSPPHDTVAYVIPAEVLEVGREEYRALLAKLEACERSKRWPGRAENEVAFALPAYLTRDEDDDLDDLALEGDARARRVAELNEGL